MKGLAAHLGLSPTTVSRVLNHSGGEFRIAAKTQERVIKAAAQLNYEPNAFARGLRKRRSFTIGVMVPEISEGYSAQVLGGIEDALLQEEFFYFVVSHRHRADLLEGYPRLLLSRSVEGIIAVDTPIHQDLPVPVVAVSGHSRKHHIVTIELDHLAAAKLALSHLHDLGHRRIAFIKGQTFSSDTRVRWEAIRKTCSTLDIRVHPELVVQLEGTAPGSEPGLIATRKLLSGGHRFTAIFAFNDASAIGAFNALHEAGLHVPRDVSVVGFDDIPSAATMHPSLTTVRQPLRAMGQSAAETLLRLIRSGPALPYPPSILVSPAFVKRHSTGKAASTT
ncbi:MAG TPA: LacI family DNA-binding transcriptional regulator [Acidobacteriaceae bacterium]|nr:LacI family DNA-binding transcriptional regulator [Acidobacteriaceae bacterium]